MLLGVNIDHIATVRNARGTIYPSPVEAALIAETHGADLITMHLREDRRHIKDADVFAVKNAIRTRLNLEMALTEEMLENALNVMPEDVCLVPEKRQEVTTEGGLDVLAQIRNGGCTVPVLIVTARDDLHSRLNGLDAGADDYIVKPFDMAELQARMRAVLRRHGGQAQTLLTNGIIMLNPSTHQAEVVGQEQAIMLSNKEFAVLQALLLRPGMILSRSDLEDKIYGWGEEVESNAVDFLIHALRKKLGKEAIQNVRGVGWLVAQNNQAV